MIERRRACVLLWSRILGRLFVPILSIVISSVRWISTATAALISACRPPPLSIGPGLTVVHVVPVVSVVRPPVFRPQHAMRRHLAAAVWVVHALLWRIAMSRVERWSRLIRHLAVGAGIGCSWSLVVEAVLRCWRQWRFV